MVLLLLQTGVLPLQRLEQIQSNLEVSPHAHRGAFRPPRRRGCSKDSRSHYKRDIKWVKEGAQEDLINQEFDGHSLHHPEVQSEWSTFIQSAASVSKEMQSAPAVAPVERSITRTLSVGGTRILGLEMRARDTSKDLAWVTVPDTEVDFPLYDGSMFVLDTDDEEQRLRPSPDGRDVDGAWFHGMMQAVASDEISCGFIARKVRSVRDVCCQTDVVLDRRRETDKYDAVARMWKETCALVHSLSPPSGNGTSVKAVVVVISTRRFSVKVRTVYFADGLIHMCPNGKHLTFKS